MIDIALDPITNDLVFNNFDLSLVDDLDQIAQNLAIRLRFFLAEWYLNIDIGLPYYQIFFVKSPNEIQVESVLKEEIVNTRGVAELLSFSSTFDKAKRIFSVKFTARTVENEEIMKEMELPV
ncbi:MAG: hypothetical protein QXI16_01010 [Sulfolobaceae archaeon]